MHSEFPDNLQSSRNIATSIPKVTFLHYCPHSQSFDKVDQHVVKDIKEIERTYKVKVDDMVSSMLEEEKQTLNIIPKKANIDLKRSIQPKLDKLRRRTEKTVVSILNKRYQTETAKVKDEPKQVQVYEIEEEKYDDINYFGTGVYDRAVEFDLDEDYEDEE